MKARSSIRALFATLVASVATAAGCSSDDVPPAGNDGCSINSECNNPFICAFKRCHNQCASSRDCAEGQRCVQARDVDTGTLIGNVCQLNEESRCSKNSDCPGSLICGIDGQCRVQCQQDKDCIGGQVCRTQTCADSDELNDRGMLDRVLDGGTTRDGAPLTPDDGGTTGAGGAGGADSGIDAAKPDGAGGAAGSGGSADGGRPDGAAGSTGSGGAAGGDGSGGAGGAAGGDGSAGTGGAAGGDGSVDGGSDGATCTAGATCVYLPDPCHKGIVSCASGSPVCTVTAANSDDGVSCGSNKYCFSGVCTAVSQTLAIVSGDAQSGLLDQGLATPVLIKLSDDQGNPVSNATLTVTPSAGAAAVISKTTPQGQATMTITLGRKPGVYSYVVTTPGANPLTVTATATAPIANTIFTQVNSTNTAGSTALPGPGTLAQIYQVQGMAAAADGTLYLSSRCAVMSLSPEGVLSVFAGSVTNCGNTGDGGPAKSARFSTLYGLALDESRRALYIADGGNSLVWAVDLADANNSVSLYAGGNSAAAGPAFGDGSAATAASLSTPGSLSVDPSDGALYIGDTGRNRIRRVDYNDRRIQAWLSPTACTGSFAFYGCGDVHGCAVVWDGKGNAFVSGNVCGTSTVSNTYGVARVTRAGTGLARVLGKYGNTGGTDVYAGNISLGYPPSLAMDPAGNLYTSELSGSSGTGYRVRRIESSTGRVVTLAGDGTSAYTGNYVDATAAQLDSPGFMAFDSANNLHFADQYSVRTIWGAGANTAPEAALSLSGGNAQSVYVDQQAALLSVKVVDGAGTAVKSGYPVSWTATEPSVALDVTTSNTSTGGVASATPRAGLLAQDYHVAASYLDIHGSHVSGSPVSFTLTANGPPAGTIFTIFNTFHAYASGDPYPAPATVTRVPNQTHGVAVASDGTVYFSTNCAVKKITPDGVAHSVAGTDACGTNRADDGPATSGQVQNAYGLALDEVDNRLYIADSGNNRIRFVEFATGQIHTLAGDGATSMPTPFGDGQAAFNAYIAGPTQVSLAGRTLYVVDTGHSYIRSIDLSAPNPIINSWVPSSSSSCSTMPLGLYSCGSADQSCSIAWSGADAYVSGYFCGTGISGFYGVAKRAANGTLTVFAGKSNGSYDEGVPATSATFGSIPTIAFDGTILYLSIEGEHRVRKIDTTATTPAVTTVAGTRGSGGYFGDYVLSTSAGVLLYNPSGLAMKNGHLVFADSNNYALRQIW